ncbi:MAG: DHHA1 domain-containing protein [Candidatus Nanoarchaeia archaeon]
MNQEFIAKLKLFLNNINESDRVGLFYHAFCTDGVCSAVITAKAFEKIAKRRIDFIEQLPVFEINEQLLTLFKEKRITKAIFVDLSLKQNEFLMKKAPEIVDILIIDHHEFKEDINSERISFLHASLWNKEIKSHAYPASKLCYDLFSYLTNMEDLDWIASVGLISDRGYKQWKEFVKGVMEKYGFEEKGDVFETTLGKISQTVGSGLRFNEYSREVFKILYSAKDYGTILKNELLVRCNDILSKELKCWLENTDKAEKHGDLVYYVINSEHELASPISTILSVKEFYGKTVIVVCDTGGEVIKISARNQVGLRVNDLLRKAVNGIVDADAGGHVPAASCKIKRDDLSKFKRQLFDVYDQMVKD